MGSDPFGPARTHSDAFGCIPTHLDAFVQLIMMEAFFSLGINFFRLVTFSNVLSFIFVHFGSNGRTENVWTDGWKICVPTTKIGQAENFWIENFQTDDRNGAHGKFSGP